MLDPELNEGVWVFATVHTTIDPSLIVASIREREGLSVVLRESDAVRLGLKFSFRSAWISLRAATTLDQVGVTAAFSAALARAGVHHDHLFVPIDQAAQALEVLRH